MSASEHGDDAARDIAKSARRMLRHGHDFWEKHQHSPDSDEMSAALTDLHMALKRHGLLKDEEDT